MIWDVRNECMSADEREALQVRHLQAMLGRVKAVVPFYSELLADVEPQDTQSLDDLHELPFTTKDDVRKYYPYGMFAVPMEDVVRVHSSSGTTGKPTVIGYTQSDIQMWAGTIARTLCGGGAVRGDVLHNAYGYGMFTGGLGLHYGGELLGLTVLPLSGGNTKRQILIMQDFGSTLISCTPSYALRLAEVAQAEGVDMTALPLRSGYMGAEPWSEAMRQKIETRAGFATYNIYGLSEVIGPGVSFECEEQNGSHINSDHFIPEVIDPETEEVLPDGQYGELVFTCPTKQCLPLVRYRTGDICSLDHTPCPCGRTTVRMSLVTGRTDDMLIVRGVNVFPSQIEEIIVGFPELEPYYQIVVDREGTLDELEVHVEVAPDYFADRVGELEAVRRRVTEETQSALGVSVQIHLAEPQSLTRSEGKATHVVDKRDFNK